MLLIAPTTACVVRLWTHAFLIVFLSVGSLRSQELLSNADFEIFSGSGKASGWNSSNVWGGAAATLSIEASSVQSGAYCQRIDITALPVGGGALFLQNISLEADATYRTRLWLRGTKGATVEVQLRQPGVGYRKTAATEITFTDASEWRLVENHGGFSTPDVVQFTVVPRSIGTIWLDAASVQPAEILANPDFETYSSPAATRAASWDLNTWFDAQATTAKEVSNVWQGGAAQAVTVTVLGSGGAILRQFFNPTAGVAYRARAWLRGTPGMQVQLSLRQKQPGGGYITTAVETVYLADTWRKLEATGGFQDDLQSEFVIRALDTGTLVVDGASLALQPHPSGTPSGASQTIPSEYFGVHFNKIGVYPLPTAILGKFGTVRLWDTGTRWSDIQPDSAAEWKWSRLDYILSQVESIVPRPKVILTLGGSPTWAVAVENRGIADAYGVPGGASPPCNVVDWQNYVAAVVARYQGRIHAYEIWNEADYSRFWQGSVEELINLAGAAHARIKALDPDAVVLTPNFTSGNGPSVLSRYLLAGGGAYADVVAIHTYFATPESALPILCGFVDIANRQAAGKPVWNTETSLTLANDADASGACAMLARMLLLQWAVGIRDSNWYCWDLDTLPGQPALSAPVQASPAALNYTSSSPVGEVYFRLVDQLVGAKMVGWETDGNGIWHLTIQRGSAQSHYLWSTAGTVDYCLPASWGVQWRQSLYDPAPVQQLSDVVTLGGEPVLFGP